MVHLVKGMVFPVVMYRGFHGGSKDKESACSAGDPGSIPGSGRPPGEGNGNPPPYSCLENPRDGGAWWAAVAGAAQSWTQLKRLHSSSMLFTLLESLIGQIT